jgi:hypothetical protein
MQDILKRRIFQGISITAPAFSAPQNAAFAAEARRGSLNALTITLGTMGPTRQQDAYGLAHRQTQHGGSSYVRR